MSFQLPDIAKTAESLLVSIEQAVQGFARYHKYTAGAQLREQAMLVTELTHRAWRDRARQLEWTERLVWAIDQLKIRLQLCKRLNAFRGPGQFWALARDARTLGKKAGGWLRRLRGEHPKDQNAAAPRAPQQRVQKLGTRATSRSIWEVYP